MNILVVGSGGREHALVWKLAQSQRAQNIYCAPGNPGIGKLAQNVDISSHDIDGLLAFARQKSIDVTVVGPEAPLVAGLADAFLAQGLFVAGPVAAAALLEGSKKFAKDIMTKYGVPTAGYQVFTEVGKAREYLRKAGRRLVLKADGLAAGKGVYLCKTLAQAEQALEEIMVERRFGAAGDTLVIEEWLDGEEASFLVFTDGKTIVPMPSSQDHKAIGEGDKGPNTGGMGAYSPAPVVTQEVAQKTMERIIRPMIRGLDQEGSPYKGILYAGLMIDEDGDPYVLEFNVRFGDPECQPLMVRLKSDLVEIMEAIAKGTLGSVKVEWLDKVSVCVVMAAGGYPGSYDTGQTISGLEEAGALQDVVVFQAGTTSQAGALVASGGRVLGVTATGETVGQAIAHAYAGVDKITWQDAYFRRDIGYRALEREHGPQVGIVMGSASDREVMSAAAKALEGLGVKYEMKVLSAHRTPDQAKAWAASAAARGIKVIIAGAGWAAHLAGAMAAFTTLPIIGVPIDSSPLGGMDALLATVQMPPGVPVATVAIGKGGAKNAAILAAQILALSDPDLAGKLKQDRKDMALSVLAADKE